MEHRSQFLIRLTQFTCTLVFRRVRNKRGFALLLVLASVALIALLLGAFLLATNSEVSTAASSGTDSQTQAMAGNVTQLVISQIHDATSEGSAAGTGVTYGWASQPGMIRTFNNDSTGSPHFCYKLYSSPNMVEKGATYQSSIAGGSPEDYPTGWYSSPGTYTDLNEPVRDVTGAMNYPILDPSGCASFTSPTSSAPYILGFTVSGAPTNAGTSTFQNPVPMPVAWLYVLKNGQVISPDTGSTTNVVTFKNATTVPTPANPLVGRMAFWTDDETCKVNINTAGEGLFWDTPRATANVAAMPSASNFINSANNESSTANDTEFYYSWFQPATNELQRYPGHPAQVALSPILGPNYAKQLNAQVGYTGTPYTFPTAPRLTNLGGSQLGTIAYNNPPAAVNFSNADRKALYASIDELFFSNYAGSASSARGPNDKYYNYPRTTFCSIDKPALQAGKFFLTANSRAPEVNMFNLPRLACWPIDNDLLSNGTGPYNTASKYTTGFDKLIAFCSSLRIGGTGTPLPYYFQRAANSTYDGSEGGTATSDAAGNYDWDKITRNQSLFAYLQYLTNQNVPGFGSSLASKYGGVSGLTDCNQILTEIFDYIRTTNPNDANLASGYQYVASHTGYATSTTGAQWIKPTYMATCNGNALGTMGFGRTFTLREVAVELVCVGDATVTAASSGGWDGNNAAGKNTVLVANSIPQLTGTQKAYQAAILFRPQCVTPGNAYPTPDLFIQCSGLASFSIGGTTPFSDTATPSTANAVLFNNLGGNGAGYTYSGGIENPYTFFTASNNVPSNCGNPSPNYYFVSKPFIVNSGTIPFTGGSFTIYLYEAKGQTKPAATLTGATDPSFIQQITVNFPTTTLPAPNLDVSAANTATATNYPPLDPTTTPRSAVNWGFNRLQGANSAIAGPVSYYGYSTSSNSYDRNVLYNPNDVIRSVSIIHGDARLVAAQRAINDAANAVFATRTDSPFAYTSSTAPFSCYFPNFSGGPSGNSTLIASLNEWATGTPFISYAPSGGAKVFTADAPPYTTTSTANTTMYTGDWDNSTGNLGPGSFINKPDDGDSTIFSSGNYYPYFYVSGGAGLNSAIGSAGTANYVTSFNTPNRLIPSPGVLGSLPTGVVSQKPWQTLLFRPDRNHPKSPYDTSGTQRTAGWPPDHLFMDLFWMPVVQPYAISDCFSTAGKINLNYQIVPFTYITRNTALYCLIHGGTNPTTAASGSGSATGEKLFSVPNANAVQYSSGTTANPSYYKATASSTWATSGYSFRSDVNCGNSSQTTGLGSDPVGELGGTFRQFKQRFTAGDIFGSPSEISDIYLVPQGQNWSTAGSNWTVGSDGETYWKTNHQATADNDRERPYTDLYGRLTTKSNTFLVHMRVQSIKQNPAEIASTPAQWTEGTDAVTGEYRGSSLIERYIDPADPNLQDYAAIYAANPTLAPGTTPTLNDLYKYRVVYNKQFSP